MRYLYPEVDKLPKRKYESLKQKNKKENNKIHQNNTKKVVSDGCLRLNDEPTYLSLGSLLTFTSDRFVS